MVNQIIRGVASQILIIINHDSTNNSVIIFSQTSRYFQIFINY
jgi:hypothetical protein